MKTELVYVNGEIWKISAEELKKYLRAVIERTGHQGIDTVDGEKVKGEEKIEYEVNKIPESSQ